MKKLPLYQVPPVGPVTTLEHVPINSSCKKCELHKSARTVCMRPELVTQQTGKERIAVIGVSPTAADDDRTGRPFTSTTGRWVREQLKRIPSEAVLLDNAIRCPMKEFADLEAVVDSCRAYLATALAEFRPTRILALGSGATRSLLGRYAPPDSVRRGFGWYLHPDDVDEPVHTFVPVFLLDNPVYALQNRFSTEDLRNDIHYALTTPLPSARFMEQFVYEVETVQDMRACYKACEYAGMFSYDTETSGRAFDKLFRIEALTVWPSGLQHGYKLSTSLDNPEVVALMTQLLSNEHIKKVGHNIKYDMVATLADPRIATFPAGVFSDTRLTRKLLEPEVAADLATAAELVGHGGYKEEARRELSEICRDLNALANEPLRAPTQSGRARKPPALKRLRVHNVRTEHLEALRKETVVAEQLAYHYMTPTVRDTYNGRDAQTTMALHEELYSRLRAEPGRLLVHDKISIPATRALAHIEAWGFLVDQEALYAFDNYLALKLYETERHLKSVADINFNSPKQLGELLFDKLKLPLVKERSTDASVLKALESKHPIVASLLRHRKLAKLRGTYAKGMIPHIRDDGRIHPTYLIDGAVTGRISCADPNLQNITSPERDEKNSDEQFGKMCRDIFVVPDDYDLFEGDMAQQELRVAAFLSGDETLISEFLAVPPVDIHAKTASVVYGVPIEQVTKAQRTRSKTVTFGLLYGKTDEGLAEQLGITLEEAREIRKTVLGRFKQLAVYLRAMVRRAHSEGGVYTWWDGNERARWRPLYDVAANGPKARPQIFHAENAAVNTPIQGTAADFVTASLWPLVSWIIETRAPAKVVCTVHDSILVECRKDFTPTLARKMHQIMTSHNSGRVPLVPDFKCGPRWGSMKHYELK